MRYVDYGLCAWFPYNCIDDSWDLSFTGSLKATKLVLGFLPPDLVTLDILFEMTLPN